MNSVFHSFSEAGELIDVIEEIPISEESGFFTLYF